MLKNLHFIIVSCFLQRRNYAYKQLYPPPRHRLSLNPPVCQFLPHLLFLIGLLIYCGGALILPGIRLSNFAGPGHNLISWEWD
jgi:hypothetical protein